MAAAIAKWNLNFSARGVWCTSGNHYAGFWAAQSNGLATNDEGMTRHELGKQDSTRG